ncbi:hypothetical protein, partial [Hypericibacter sp.]|uniref:hypothetical protein n=1 Tax=Hypericibacter sp. TaxID=2705401 RepID=UPI003D6CEA40
TLLMVIVGAFALAWVMPAYSPYLLALIAACLVAIFAAFIYFAIKDPTLLLSEDHQHRKAVLALLGDNRQGFSQRGADLTLTGNPATDILPAPGPEEQP